MSRHAQVFKSHPVLITFSVLTGAQVLTAGTLLSEAIGEKSAGLVVLVVASVQAGMTFYVSNQVVTKKRVVAKRSKDGRIVSGEGANIRPNHPVTVLVGDRNVEQQE